MLAPSKRGEPDARFMQETPPSAVRSIAAGPRATVAVGFEDGTVGLWSVETGRLLWSARLHGGVLDLAIREERLHVLTELGDGITQDLTHLGRDYCTTMREVWEMVPVCWEGSRPAACGPPEDHACAPSSG